MAVNSEGMYGGNPDYGLRPGDVTPDGKKVVRGADGELYVQDLRTTSQLKKVGGRVLFAASLALVPSGIYAAGTTVDEQATFIDVSDPTNALQDPADDMQWVRDRINEGVGLLNILKR